MTPVSPDVPTAEGPHAGLSVRGLCKSYGPNRVVMDASLDVRPGEVVALLGENGAGKSTLSNMIAGAVRSDAGAMSWRGAPYAPASPADAIAAGIGMIHQELKLVPDLSVAENVFVGRLPMRAGAVDRKAMRERAVAQLRRLGLDVSPDRLVRTLRVAAQQQVEIAKALALEARLLILDEPTAALGGEETELLFEQIRRLKAEGMGFIYISHRLDEIARIADRIVVMRDGRVVAQHPTADVPVRTVVAEMVGRSVDRMFPELAPPRPDRVLQVDGLRDREGRFGDISFDVHAGEILGIAGLIGAGRTELVRTIAGVDPLASGTIRLDGAALHLSGPAAAISAGIVLVPEDRKAQGLVLEQTIANNLAYGNFDKLAPRHWLRNRTIRDFAERAIAQLGIKGRTGQTAASLSGGNQQKVVIAKWLQRPPRLFILDEPTRGIDVGARAAIYDVIARLAASGMAVVMVSSDLEEVLGMSHRVMVMSRGRQRGILARGEASNVAVMELATS